MDLCRRVYCILPLKVCLCACGQVRLHVCVCVSVCVCVCWCVRVCLRCAQLRPCTSCGLGAFALFLLIACIVISNRTEKANLGEANGLHPQLTRRCAAALLKGSAPPAPHPSLKECVSKSYGAEYFSISCY